jgi:hypothetical protein
VAMGQMEVRQYDLREKRPTPSRELRRNVLVENGNQQKRKARRDDIVFLSSFNLDSKAGFPPYLRSFFV